MFRDFPSSFSSFQDFSQFHVCIIVVFSFLRSVLFIPFSSLSFSSSGFMGLYSFSQETAAVQHAGVSGLVSSRGAMGAKLIQDFLMCF